MPRSAGRSVGRSIARAFVPLPDALTAIACFCAWWAPLALPVDLLRSMALIIVIEFLTIHAAVMVPLCAFFVRGRPGMALAMGLASAVYALMALGASLALDTWWPSLFFVWLLASRYALPIWTGREGDEVIDQGQLWLVSTLLWLGLAFPAMLLPLPAPGWDADVQRLAGLPGTGVWAAEPQRLLAFAGAYFALLALFKVHAAVAAGRIPSTPAAPGMAAQRRDAREEGARAMAERRQRLAERRAGQENGRGPVP